MGQHATHDIKLRDNARGFKLLDDELGMPIPNTPLWSITDIRFGHLQDWPLEVALMRDAAQLNLIFRDVVSFRAQDESEILSHWAARGNEQVAVGSIYQIEQSAYLDEFSTSTSAITDLDIHHYLIAGYDLCVEVLATRPPELSQDVSHTTSG